MTRMSRTLAAAAAVVTAAGGSVLVALDADAAAGCRVDYTVTSGRPDRAADGLPHRPADRRAPVPHR